MDINDCEIGTLVCIYDCDGKAYGIITETFRADSMRMCHDHEGDVTLVAVLDKFGIQHEAFPQQLEPIAKIPLVVWIKREGGLLVVSETIPEGEDAELYTRFRMSL